MNVTAWLSASDGTQLYFRQNTLFKKNRIKIGPPIKE